MLPLRLPSWAFLLACCSSPCLGDASAKPPALEFCIDQSDWFPQTFAVRGEARGVHVDVIRCALQASAVQYLVRPLPWPRCLRWVGKGRLAGAATATFTAERATYLQYPRDAETNIENSLWAVGYDEDLVVTPAVSRYVYPGGLADLPSPVRVPRGWSIAAELRALGVDVDDGAIGDEDNLHKLLRSRNGSVIATSTSLNVLLLNPDWAGAVRVQSTPVRRRAYHLVFSKLASQLTADDQQRIWNAVRWVRENPALMTTISSRYTQIPPGPAGRSAEARLRLANTALDCSPQSR